MRNKTRRKKKMSEQRNLYKPEEYKEKETVKEGTKQKAKVVSIEEGFIGQFIEEEVLSKWKGVDPQSPAIEVTVKADDGSQRKRVMPIPQDGYYHKNSNIAKWKRIYGGWPAIGQEVELIADNNGFWNFLF